MAPRSRTTRTKLAGFGGYAAIEDRPGDDLLVGVRLIAEQGFEVVLLPYEVETVPDYQSMRALIQKRLRWITVMRHMRPWGHLGLMFTQSLPWSIAAVAIHPTLPVALGFFGTYLAMRVAMTWMIGVHGLKQRRFWKQMPLIPVGHRRVFHLDDQLPAAEHPVARVGLLHPQWKAGTGKRLVRCPGDFVIALPSRHA